MNISKEEFKKIYYITRDKEIAKMLGVKSVATIRHYAKELGLKLKGFGYIYPDDLRKEKKVNFQ